MPPLTIIITHTDWDGPQPQWIRQPMLPFSRNDRASWDKVFYELGTIARVDSVAIGCRGTFDPPAVACLPIARAAYDAAQHKPSVTFWADTVGLPDITHNLAGQPFDFGNAQHLRWAWQHFVGIFFAHFGNATLTRSPNTGRVLIPWWGIHSSTGHGFVNQRLAQMLLDYIDQEVAALGLGHVDHLVDKTWLEYQPNLHAWGVHNWFNPWSTPPISATVRTHKGISAGVVVPGFSDPNRPLPEKIAHGAATAQRGFAACADCDVVVLEGATDFQEGAEWMRDASGNTDVLDAIRTFVGAPFPEPQPPTEPKDDYMPATLCLRRAERTPHPSRSGYYTSPYPGQAPKVLSVQENGSLQARPAGTSGPFESWREEGNRAVFDDVFGHTYALPLVD